MCCSQVKIYMKKNLFALLSLVSAFSLMGCNTNVSSTSKGDIPSVSSSTALSSSTTNSSSSTSEEGTWIDGWVSAVSDTASIIVSKKSEGNDVDYVVSSYPVVAASLAKNTSGSVKEDLGKKFAEKYGTSGFPQAGLFIKTSLEEDTTKVSSVVSFLNSFDAAITDLIGGGTNAIKNMNDYGNDDDQTTLFGFKSAVLTMCQKNNGNKLAFISKENNPDVNGFAKFQDTLGFSVSDSELSSHYPTKETSKSTDTASSLDFTVTSPSGAPSAAFSQFARSSNLTIASPANVSAALNDSQSDFIMFDSVNGLNLIKKKSLGYKLVRMVTFGNLYLVATGHDSDDSFSKSDYTIGYGENLIPGKVTKLLYQD